MSIVFRKLDQSISTLNKKGQPACWACFGMEKTGTSPTTFLLSFLYLRSSKYTKKKLLLVTLPCVCVTCMYMQPREKCFRPVVAYLKISPSLILFRMEEERYRKKNAVRLIGGKKKECTGLLYATESGENASFSYGHLGEIPPFTDNIPTKIY